MTISPTIFKAYDIRGVVDKTLTEDAARAIGRALGALGASKGVKTFVVGRDGRLSGPRLVAALSEGLTSTGMDVVDIGMVATPMVYFATFHLNTGSGVMVTGSHNPPDYNGLKMMVAGETLSGDAIQELRKWIEKNEPSPRPSPKGEGDSALRGAAVPPPLGGGRGRVSTFDVREPYLQRITSDVKLARPMKIAIDCGNGSPGAFAPELFRRLGCEVEALFCEVDGTFPNHHPDPAKPENLQDLIAALRDGDSEIGLAFDGDGDRLGVVTKRGSIIYPDRQLMLFAADVLTRHPGGEVIFDVKSTRNLYDWIRRHGGKPTLWKTGHSLIKAKLKETGAPLAGEMSGHVFFKDRWFGFDDGLYAGARLLEILSRVADPTQTLESLPDSISTPELHVELSEGENHALIAAMQKDAKFDGAKEVITLDGLRVHYADGFGLIRASNTTPVVVLRFEADSPEAMARIRADFARVLRIFKPDARIPA